MKDFHSVSFQSTTAALLGVYLDDILKGDNGDSESYKTFSRPQGCRVIGSGLIASFDSKHKAPVIF